MINEMANVSVKAKCTASLKQKVFVAIQKSIGNIEFATCQCPARRAVICSYSCAVLKVIVKWVIDRVFIILQHRACTSNPCASSLSQDSIL